MPLGSGQDENQSLESAISVAQTLSAHLEVLFIRPDPETRQVYTGMLPSDRIAADIRERIDELGEAAALQSHHHFDYVCRKTNMRRSQKPRGTSEPSAHWREIKGEALSVYPAAARNADLAILGCETMQSDSIFGGIVRSTLLGSGSPVLFTPNARVEKIFDRPLIAWDGGTACVRALSAWLATEQIPDEAVILHIEEPDDEPPDLEDVAARLAWHGIRSKIEIRKRGLGSITDALLTAAQDHQCGLIVMGGYGRFRYSEALFGGVTRHVIRNASMPLLMMH